MMNQDQSGQRLQIAMVIHPDLTLLDLVGPQMAWAMHADTHIVWKTLDPIRSDTGMIVTPTMTFADCPEELDVIFVPGGMATFDIMMDPEVVEFVRSRGQKARYVTSVCTGSLVLAAAGLLDGYKAATHWATTEILDAFGVEVVNERVVVDRNRFTGGGVTAGIDFGLTVLAELCGEQVAKSTQLLMEYDPRPPYDCGSPRTADPELVRQVKSFTQQHDDRGLENARKIQRDRLIAA